MKNPFNHLYYWVKGEILDVMAFQESLAQRNQITTMLQKTISRKAGLTSELEKLIGGRKSIRTLFKSRSEKDTYAVNLQTQIDQLDKSIEGLIMIGIILDWHLGDTIMPLFKKEKVENFHLILREMAAIEVENSNIGATYWSKVLSNSNLKHF